jgi:aldehyde:ferredoxin oxidoreductase
VLAAALLAGDPLRRRRGSARSRGGREAGGYWGPEPQDGRVRRDRPPRRSPEPVWLWVKDGAASSRDGRGLWDQDPVTVLAAIREVTGEKLARVLQIGRAGENLVPYAMIMSELRHYNGRTGMGAVMGSKNLRAIGVKGSRR